MVTKYGMSEDVGLICYDDEEEVFIGRDLGHTRGYSETVATRIDGEIKRIVDECYAKARQMIREHEDVLHRCAELSKNLLEMHHGLCDISVKCGEGYLRVMAKVHKNNEQNL